MLKKLFGVTIVIGDYLFTDYAISSTNDILKMCIIGIVAVTLLIFAIILFVT